MGQRLVITVEDRDSRPILSAYFHWGGYTRPAIRRARDFMEEYRHVREMCASNVAEGRMKAIPDARSIALLTALRAWVGSGIAEGDPAKVWDLIKEQGFDASILSGDPSGQDRTAGQIYISPGGIAGIKGWAEFEVRIEVRPDGGSAVSRFDPIDWETLSTYEEDFGEEPEYLEVPGGVERFLMSDLKAEDLLELERLFDRSPNFAIGCAAENRMLVEVC